MKRKRILLLTVLTAISGLFVCVQADDIDLYLVFNSSYEAKPNGAICLDLSNLRTLSFGKSSERILKATYQDNHVDTISTTVIDYLYFGSAPVKVETVTSDNTSSMKIQGNILNIHADNATTLMVFSLSGVKLMSTQLAKGTNSISISSLPKGIYIARTDKLSLKFYK